MLIASLARGAFDDIERSAQIRSVRPEMDEPDSQLLHRLSAEPPSHPLEKQRGAATAVARRLERRGQSIDVLERGAARGLRWGKRASEADAARDERDRCERCDLQDAQLCKTMLDILRNQQNRCGIPRYLEFVDTSDTPSAIANKTGELDDVRNDVALISSKSAQMIISAFTWDNKDQRWTCDNDAQLLIARMAEAIVKTWLPRGVRTVSK